MKDVCTECGKKGDYISDSYGYSECCGAPVIIENKYDPDIYFSDMIGLDYSYN